MNYFCINKSGKILDVYDNYKNGSVIGHIYNREAFGWNYNWGGDQYYLNIAFRNSSGNVVGGFLINPPTSGFTYCTEYPYGTVTISGVNYKTFYMRRDERIYTPDKVAVATAHAGCQVACQTAQSGDSEPTWKLIHYFLNTSTGRWIRVNESGAGYGFVNTGLDYGSEWDNIPFYGSW